MEMVPNYTNEIPLIGPSLSDFLLDFFTLSRALVAHVVIFPVIMLVLMDIHTLSKIKKRAGGLSLYVLEHSLFATPFLIAIAILAYALPMPTQDPAIIPMPLEGEGIPTAEWFVLIFYAPYLYFKGFMATLFGFYIPFAVFLVLAIFPYYLKSRRGARIEQEAHHAEKRGVLTHILTTLRKALPMSAREVLSGKTLAKTVGVLSVTVAAMILFIPFYAVARPSPTLGCNSCHNLTAGIRMGVPPPTFKDRALNPNLKNNTFMVEHWFYPQVVW